MLFNDNPQKLIYNANPNFEIIFNSDKPSGYTQIDEIVKRNITMGDFIKQVQYAIIKDNDGNLKVEDDFELTDVCDIFLNIKKESNNIKYYYNNKLFILNKDPDPKKFNDDNTTQIHVIKDNDNTTEINYNSDYIYHIYLNHFKVFVTGIPKIEYIHIHNKYKYFVTVCDKANKIINISKLKFPVDHINKDNVFFHLITVYTDRIIQLRAYLFEYKYDKGILIPVIGTMKSSTYLSRSMLTEKVAVLGARQSEAAWAAANKPATATPISAAPISAAPKSATSISVVPISATPSTVSKDKGKLTMILDTNGNLEDIVPVLQNITDNFKLFKFDAIYSHLNQQTRGIRNKYIFKESQSQFDQVSQNFPNKENSIKNEIIESKKNNGELPFLIYIDDNPEIGEKRVDENKLSIECG